VPSAADGDLPQIIVDVKGDTFCEVTIPYLHPYVWRPSGTFANSDPKIYCQMITDIAGSTAPSSPIIYCNVWRSAGEDFQWMHPRNTYEVYYPTPPKERKLITGKELPKAQCSIGPRFKRPFKPIMEGACYSHELGTCSAEMPIRVSDVMKRWNQRTSSDAGSAGFDVRRSTGNAQYNCEAFPYFGASFLFWRGSRRIRFMNAITDYVTDTLWTSGMPNTGTAGKIHLATNTTYDGTNIVPNNPTTSVEMPWLCEVPYAYVELSPEVPNTPQFDPPVGCNYIQSSLARFPEELYWAPGDDFQYLYHFPPPIPPS